MGGCRVRAVGSVLICQSSHYLLHLTRNTSESGTAGRQTGRPGSPWRDTPRTPATAIILSADGKREGRGLPWYTGLGCMLLEATTRFFVESGKS